MVQVFHLLDRCCNRGTATLNARNSIATTFIPMALCGSDICCLLLSILLLVCCWIHRAKFSELGLLRDLAACMPHL